MLVLTTLDKTKKSLIKVIREYESKTEEPDHAKAKILLHGFTVLLSYIKYEKDLEIEKRLEALEERFNNDK